MMEELDITEDALLQALMATEPGPENNPVGAMTTRHLRAITGWSIQRVRDRLRELIETGKIERVLVYEIDLAGRNMPRSGFRVVRGGQGDNDSELD